MASEVEVAGGDFNALGPKFLGQDFLDITDFHAWANFDISDVLAGDKIDMNGKLVIIFSGNLWTDPGVFPVSCSPDVFFLHRCRITQVIGF